MRRGGTTVETGGRRALGRAESKKEGRGGGEMWATTDVGTHHFPDYSTPFDTSVPPHTASPPGRSLGDCDPWQQSWQAGRQRHYGVHLRDWTSAVERHTVGSYRIHTSRDTYFSKSLSKTWFVSKRHRLISQSYDTVSPSNSVRSFQLAPTRQTLTLSTSSSPPSKRPQIIRDVTWLSGT